MVKILFSFFILLFLGGCSFKQPLSSTSATIIFQANGMKFYDKGFITKYEDKIHLTIFSFGQVALDIDIYQDRICQSTLACLTSREFNVKYLSSSYQDDFLYELFSASNINFKDKQNQIKIKVIDK